MTKPLTIAMDGPVGAGKSTIADAVAQKLNILHLDTGAMYRAVGVGVQDKGGDIYNEEEVCALLENEIRISVAYENGAQKTLLCGNDVSHRIRTQEAGTAASAVSRYAGVRKSMVALQQEIARTQPILMDGRDIGTVVLPDATVKIYLTASDEVRATRRMNQLREKGDNTPFETILEEVRARDYQDMNRAVTPLRKADDAILVDSSDFTFEQTVQHIIDLVEERYAKS
ncbi:MAG: (d)CMP kinase [Clostridia bacterium]|nr:(d)CMP kinase [Clostridia bacterium]